MTTDRPAELRFDDRVYSLDTIKRAAYRFTDRAAFDFSLAPGEIVCVVAALADSNLQPVEELLKDFQIEVLDQDLRQQIAFETTARRNTILAHVFSNAIVSQSE